MSDLAKKGNDFMKRSSSNGGMKIEPRKFNEQEHSATRLVIDETDLKKI
jgi:hypothetical protein